MPKKILLVRKMSSLEFHYRMNHSSQELKEGHEENNASVKKIEEMLRKSGISFDIITRDILPQINFEDYFRVISAGGDGTVIAVAAYNQNIPQLNIKTDRKSKGVLCCNQLEDAVESLVRENFNIEKWTRQEIYLNGRLIARALNETCVGEDMNFSKMAKYHISLSLPSEDEIQDYHENSGLVIVTGTGSTGWPKAFSAYPRTSEIFRFITIIPAVGNLNQGEFSSCSLVYKNHLGKVAIDTVKYDLPRDSMLEIKLSEFPLQVIVPKI